MNHTKPTSKTKTHRSVNNYINSLHDQYSKILAIRVDLGYLKEALLHKSEGRRDYPSPRRSYAMAPTGTVLGRPSCVKRLSRATRTCNSTTCRSNVRAITRWPRRLKQCILVSTRLLR